jgi:hypothetical protein
MTTTDFTVQAATRTAVLAAMGATSGSMFAWPTASAVLDMAQGRLTIVTDLESSPDDLDSVCTLLELSGYDSGGPWAADPGEPSVDYTTMTCTWNLALGASVG